MGHSQFAEIIGARGPNTQVNAACASATQALSLAEDWIRAGRCRRVVVVSADDVTGDALIESAQAARERGLAADLRGAGRGDDNSAYHGTRLDVDHIGAVMEAVVRQAEARGVQRSTLAESTVFVSHETYTPARGGSASAEISALRHVFGAAADRIVITNTKGFTGHAMGAGIEDVVAVKVLETGLVPPVPNYREPDPELGVLNLSRGGSYPVRHALRLAAGFGSQMAMALLRWTPVADGQHRAPDRLGYTYRIVDAVAWQRWLDLLAGHDGARLETDHRRLRVVDVGAPATSHHESAVPVPYAGQLGTSPHAMVPATPTTPVPAPPIAPAPVPAAPAVAADRPGCRSGTRGRTGARHGFPGSGAPVPVAVVDDVMAQVTAVVAEMTGYPTELLEPDLDLEADLGVDTVKQAEVFAAVRGFYELERDDNLQLRDFPTLRHVADWVRDRAGFDAAPVAAALLRSTAVATAPLRLRLRWLMM
jgi:hypothetical protein